MTATTKIARVVCLSIQILLLVPGANSAVGINAVQEFFESQGFVVLHRYFQQKALDDWKRSGDKLFEMIFQKLHENGHTRFPEHSRKSPRSGGWVYAMKEGRENGFQEIVMRSPGRYEVSLMHDSFSLDLAPSLDPILKELGDVIPNLLHAKTMDDVNYTVSLIVSTPDAGEQNWHADGEHLNMDQHMPAHCLNVFVPLLNLTLDKGPTEIYPTSHFITRQESPMKIYTEDLKPPVVPTLRMGDILIFDYRVLHRGKPNLSTVNRPMLVLSFHQSWYKDVKNWPKRSLLDRS